ncbi:MAG: tyrosine-type recombinase/integrase [Paludibacteraceae bacterium]|nr:tyrosine-type recombinase/integrase [Paludibacteraceae bacterium]
MIKHRYNWQLNRSAGGILNFRVSWDNGHCACKFSSGFRVDETKWSQDAQRCKANTTHPNNISAAVINRRMSEYETAADSIFLDYYNKGEIPNVEDFKKAFLLATGKVAQQDDCHSSPLLIAAFNQFRSIVCTQNNWSDNTQKNFASLAFHLKRFNSKLSVAEFDKTQMRLFHNYMIENHYNNNTIRKIFKSLRQFVKWLIENNYEIGDAEQYTMRIKGLQDNHVVVYLTWEELLHLYAMPIKEHYLEQARDVFCFCCFTSLRYSDVANLHRSDVKPNTIEVITQKTAEPLSIDLNNYSRAILSKYKDRVFEDNRALPVCSNQKMNSFLKEVAKQAKLDTEIRKVHYSGSQRIENVYKKWELITTHCGRRTFIVNALYLGIPAEVVMKWTGHADYKAMKPYIAIVDDLKSREMQKFNIGLPAT